MTECSRCGDCCERIGYFGSWTYLQEWADWWDSHCEWAMHNLRDGEDGGVELDAPSASTLANARFMLAHWRPNVEDGYRAMPTFHCDMFDHVTRLCTAHDRRPPICSGYPWYGDKKGEAHHRLPPRCSFWADVPLEHRPGAKLRLLPVVRMRTE